LVWAIAVAAIVLLTGCVGARRPEESPAVAGATLGYWQAVGRLGVTGPQGGGSGSFDWQQQGAISKIQLRGPLGIGSLQLTLLESDSATEMRLATGDGQEYEADAALAELEARLGARIPTQNLRYWMLGVPAPGEHRWVDAANAPAPSANTAVLEQDGWRIEYRRYSDDAGPRLPVQIRAINGATNIRILIDRWNISP
jgi:outer membrane lipoprotein LolB